MPTPAATARTHGTSSSPPASAIPTGASGTVATIIASASPVPPGKTWPTRALRRMYAAQQAPGRGQGHPEEVARPARREHRDTERTDELERDRDAERDAVE